MLPPEVQKVLTEEELAEFEALSYEERLAFVRSLELPPTVVPTLFEYLDYKRTPATPKEFFTDPYFIGDRVWDPVKQTGLYPAWLDELCYVLDPQNNIYEWIMKGAIGVGKTLVAVLALLYWLHRLNCLYDAHDYLGMMRGEAIEFFFFNISLVLAEDNALARFDNYVNSSPYFRSLFPEDRRSKPSKVYKDGKYVKQFKLSYPPYFSVVGGSGTQHQIGRNIVCSVLDEMNFAHRAAKERFNYDEASRSYAMYDAIRKRIASRFMTDGRVNGLLVLISSAGSQFDFLEQHTRRVRDNKNVHISEFSRWKVSPWKYSGPTFKIFVGGANKNSKILEDGEEEPPVTEGRVIEVPIDFRQDFTDNLASSLRDIAGIPSDVVSPLIPIREQIAECIDVTRTHPFTSESLVCGHLSDLSPVDFVVPEMLAVWGGSYLVPKYHPNSIRHIHVDLGLTNDCAGIAMGCVGSVRDLVSRGPEGKTSTSYVPEIWMDFILQMKPPVAPEQISIEAILKFIKYLQETLNFRLGAITFDGYQSAHAIQILQNDIDIKKKSGSRKMLGSVVNADFYPYSKVLSVDKNSEPYSSLRAAILEHRFKFYPYPIFSTELARLQLDNVTKRVDHLPGECFPGDTRIPLLDGTLPMIEELVGKEVWLYSTAEDGSFIPARATGKMSGYATEFVDVELDNGAVVRCTPSHRWRLLNGEYKQAKDLRSVIDRLMPLNRQWPRGGGYEEVRDKYSRKSTHKVVHEHLFGPTPKGYVVHHVDHVKTNNDPTNLDLETKEAHSRYHTTLRHETDSVYTQSVAASLQKFNLSERGRKVHSENMKRLHSNKTRGEWVESTRKRKAFRSDITVDSLLMALKDPEATNANSAARIVGCSRNVVVRVLKDHGYSSWSEFVVAANSPSEDGSNHRVRSVQFVTLPSPVAVYDLSVPESQNFSLSCGVVVHNSKDTADACAGVAYHCQEQLRSLGVHVAQEAAVLPSPMQRAIETRENWLLGDYVP